MLALSTAFAACSGGTTVEPSPVAEVVTEAPVQEDTPMPPTEVAAPVLEIVGLSESKLLTMEELKALPVTEGYEA